MLNGKDFSKRLEFILDFYGLTASALAEEIDFNRSTISHLVSGRNKPSLEFVMKLLQKFPELDMDWLVLGKGNSPSESSPKSVENKLKIDPAPTSEKVVESVVDQIPISKLNSPLTNNQKIEKIVIFFRDGTFKLYQN